MFKVCKVKLTCGKEVHFIAHAHEVSTSFLSPLLKVPLFTRHPKGVPHLRLVYKNQRRTLEDIYQPTVTFRSGPQPLAAVDFG